MQTKYILLAVGVALLVSVGVGVYFVTSDNDTSTEQGNEQESEQAQEQEQEQGTGGEEIKTSGELSVEEYARWCGNATQQLAVQVGEPYEGYKVRVAELTREVNDITSPAELEELHELHKQEIETEYERIKNKPDDEEFDPFELANDPELLRWVLEFTDKKRTALNALPQTTQNTLLQSGCIDQSDLQQPQGE